MWVGGCRGVRVWGYTGRTEMGQQHRGSTESMRQSNTTAPESHPSPSTRPPVSAWVMTCMSGRGV